VEKNNSARKAGQSAVPPQLLVTVDSFHRACGDAGSCPEHASVAQQMLVELCVAVSKPLPLTPPPAPTPVQRG
jgi:hypothetical protein